MSRLLRRLIYVDVTITRETHKTLEASNVLAKITAKDESPIKGKGKTKLELPSLEDFDVNYVHQGYMTRLSESQDL